MTYGICFYNKKPVDWLKDPNGHLHEYMSRGAAKVVLDHFCGEEDPKDVGVEVREFPEDEENEDESD